MQLHPLALALLVPALFSASAARAADAVIANFSASTLQVAAGGTVDFEVGYGLGTTARRDGANEPNEPAAREGWQEWVHSWYVYELETPMWITVHAAGQGFTDLPMSPTAGSSITGSWRFSMLFPDAGRHEVTAGGDWSVWRSVENGAEISSRWCSADTEPYEGDTALNCDSWSTQYPHSLDFSAQSGVLNTLSLQIEVLAVPEPGSLALWLCGAGLVGWRLRRAAPAR